MITIKFTKEEVDALLISLDHERASRIDSDCDSDWLKNIEGAEGKLNDSVLPTSVL